MIEDDTSLFLWFDSAVNGSVFEFRLHHWLPHLSGLTSLTLALTFPSIWSDLLPTNLRQFELSNIGDISQQCPSLVLAALTQLTRLSLQCSPFVNDEFIGELGTLSKLKQLFLNCTSVTGSGFRKVLMPSLQQVAIGSDVNADGLSHLCGAAPSLQDLRLDRCKKVMNPACSCLVVLAYDFATTMLLPVCSQLVSTTQTAHRLQ
jgi:hypothetical protein